MTSRVNVANKYTIACCLEDGAIITEFTLELSHNDCRNGRILCFSYFDLSKLLDEQTGCTEKKENDVRLY